MENEQPQYQELKSFPTLHSPVDLEPCPQCQEEERDYLFFNFECPSCVDFLENKASIGDLFSLLRQWVASVQKFSYEIIYQMLERGAHVDDRDGLTDMTILHYAVKSGARGVGDDEGASQAVQLLLEHGADPCLRCRWTNMAAIHYACFFNAQKSLEVLLDATKGVEIDSLCCEFDQGSPLHITCRCLALECLSLLLERGGDPLLKDSKAKQPIDWLPDLTNMEGEKNLENNSTETTKKIIDQMKNLLSSFSSSSKKFYQSERQLDQSKKCLSLLGIKIGDKVFVAGLKKGFLRYCGPTLFSSGIWAGVELEDQIGKNNGSIDNIQYFKCSDNYGVFAPISKISKFIQNETEKQNDLKSLSHSPSFHSPPSDPKSLHSPPSNSHPPYFNSSDLHFSPSDSHPLDSASFSSQEKNNKTSQDETYIKQISPGNNNNKSNKENNINHNYDPRMSCLTHSRLDLSHVTSKVNSGLRQSKVDLSRHDEREVFQLGNKVLVSGKKVGIIKFVGETNFAPGLWYGVELTSNSGKNDGSLEGIRYFTCAPNYGIFAPPPRVQRIKEEDYFDLHQKYNQRFKSTIHEEPSTQQQRSKQSNISPRRRSQFGSTNQDAALNLGTHVYCNGEMGKVLFIGGVDFAEGVWLGVEMRSPVGRHDGVVKGKRYFQCKQMHGLLVRPSKVYVRGINGAKLIDAD